jgi:hypothetical protein
MIWFLRVQDELVIAMSLAGLNEIGAAKAALARADQAMPTPFSEFDRAFAWGIWHDWIICRFLQEEAKKVVSGNKTTESHKSHECDSTTHRLAASLWRALGASALARGSRLNTGYHNDYECEVCFPLFSVSELSAVLCGPEHLVNRHVDAASRHGLAGFP